MLKSRNISNISLFELKQNIKQIRIRKSIGMEWNKIERDRKKYVVKLNIT